MKFTRLAVSQIILDEEGAFNSSFFSFRAHTELGLVPKMGFPLQKWGFLFKRQLSALPPKVILLLRMPILQVDEAYLVTLCLVSMDLLLAGTSMRMHTHTGVRSCRCLELEFAVVHVSSHDLAAGP